MPVTPKQTGSKKPDINTIEIAVKNLSEELIEVKKSLKEQRSESRTVMLGAIFAVVLLVATVVVEILIFNAQERKDCFELDIKYNERIELMKDEYGKSELENTLRYELLKAKNPYLK